MKVVGCDTSNCCKGCRVGTLEGPPILGLGGRASEPVQLRQPRGQPTSTNGCGRCAPCAGIVRPCEHRCVTYCSRRGSRIWPSDGMRLRTWQHLDGNSCLSALGLVPHYTPKRHPKKFWALGPERSGWGGQATLPVPLPSGAVLLGKLLYCSHQGSVPYGPGLANKFWGAHLCSNLWARAQQP